MDKKGFTLVEVVMVVVILSVLAAVSLPRFVNLKTQSIINNEKNIYASLNAGLKAEGIKNIASGMAPIDAFPDATSDIFSYVKDSPPHQVITSGFAASSQDNVNWRLLSNNTLPRGGTIIFCPHYDGSAWILDFDGGTHKGSVWDYNATNGTFRTQEIGSHN